MKNKLACAALFALASFNCFSTTLHGAKIISEEIKMIGNAKGQVRDINGKQYDLIINRLQPPSTENGKGRIEISLYAKVKKAKGKNGEEINVETDSDIAIYNRSSMVHKYEISQFYCVGKGFEASCFETLNKVEIEANGSMDMTKIFTMPYVCHKSDNASATLVTRIRRDDNPDWLDNMVSGDIDIVD